LKKSILFIILQWVLINSNCQLKSDFTTSTSSEDYFNFYQQNISDLRGNSCPMYPSCANYTLETIKEKGLIDGIISGSDRLMRCGHEHNYYNLTLQEKGFKLIDFPYGKSEKGYRFFHKKNLYTNNQNYNDSLLNEIASLINDGYISEAIILINKYKLSNKVLNPQIFEFEFICLNAKKEYEKVIYKYDLLDSVNNKNLSILKQYFLSCYNLENYKSIIENQDKISNPFSNDENLNTNLKKYVFLSYLNEDRINAAENYINSKYDKTEDKSLANNTIYQLRSIKTKSPILATTMSILLPGSGYVYAGHVTTGISALLINSLVGFASYNSFKSNNNGMGILSGLVFLGFYLGNIQGSSKSIIRENRFLKNKIITNYSNQSINY